MKNVVRDGNQYTNSLGLGAPFRAAGTEEKGWAHLEVGARRRQSSGTWRKAVGGGGVGGGGGGGTRNRQSERERHGGEPTERVCRGSKSRPQLEGYGLIT